MSEGNGNGNGTNRILSLDQVTSERNAKDAHGRLLRHNATVKDVYAIVAEETAKVHEFYMQQIPPFVARMVQDALVAYGLITLSQEAQLAATPAEAPEGAADATAAADEPAEVPPAKGYSEC